MYVHTDNVHIVVELAHLVHTVHTYLSGRKLLLHTLISVANTNNKNIEVQSNVVSKYHQGSIKTVLTIKSTGKLAQYLPQREEKLSTSYQRYLCTRTGLCTVCIEGTE